MVYIKRPNGGKGLGAATPHRTDGVRQRTPSDAALAKYEMPDTRAKADGSGFWS
jgi:hypothetical protein